MPAQQQAEIVVGNTTDIMQYSRNIKKSLIIYRLTYLLIALGIFLILISRSYYYLYFLPVILFLRDVIFPLVQIFVNGHELIIIRFYLGGLLKSKKKIKGDKIVSLKNIDNGTMTDTWSDSELFILSIFFSGTKKEKEMYNMTYFKNNIDTTEIRIILHENEGNIIRNAYNLQH